MERDRGNKRKVEAQKGKWWVLRLGRIGRPRETQVQGKQQGRGKKTKGFLDF